MVTRLNLSELEADPEAGKAPSRFEVSRRQALGIAGAAVAASAPGVKALESGINGSFTLSTVGGRAVFRYAGRECWVIDPKAFGGSAKLKVDRGKDLIRLRLSQAFFPGTDIPADFRAEIRNGITGWRMTLTLAMARFQGKVGFEGWLD